jgi:hypothetical protein
MSRKPAGKCIFCEAGNLSKEHFWPEWASALLPNYPINQHVERLVTFTEVTRLKEPPKSRAKPGRPGEVPLDLVASAQLQNLDCPMRRRRLANGLRSARCNPKHRAGCSARASTQEHPQRHVWDW